jgi:hypothetical protein
MAGIRKTIEKFSQERQFKDLNPGPLKFKAGELTIIA